MSQTPITESVIVTRGRIWPSLVTILPFWVGEGAGSASLEPPGMSSQEKEELQSTGKQKGVSGRAL